MRKRLKTIGMESKKERRLKIKKQLRALEQNKISDETIGLMKSLSKIDWGIYKELVRSRQVTSIYKFKTPKSIFFNEPENKFFYFNPIFKKLFYCGEFVN